MAAVRFQRSLDAQKLKPDVWRMKVCFCQRVVGASLLLCVHVRGVCGVSSPQSPSFWKPCSSTCSLVNLHITPCTSWKRTLWVRFISSFLTRQLRISPVAWDAFALTDMSQYKNLFYSTRLPFVGKDELKVNVGVLSVDVKHSCIHRRCTYQVYSPTRHIVVLRGSDLYKVNVLDESFR